MASMRDKGLGLARISVCHSWDTLSVAFVMCSGHHLYSTAAKDQNIRNQKSKQPNRQSFLQVYYTIQLYDRQLVFGFFLFADKESP